MAKPNMGKMRRAQAERREPPKRRWFPEDMVGWEDDGKDPETEHLDYESIEHMTEKAALLIIDGDKVWVPKSQILEASDTHIEVTTWWMKKQGI